MTDLLTGITPVAIDGAPVKVPIRASSPETTRVAEPVAIEHTKSKVATPQPSEQKPALTTKELAEMLRRINLTFDLFEVAAKYAIDESDGHVQVTIFNTRTGEVIRRIPPTEFQTSFNSFREGLGMLVNQLF
jgi:uncharacterized FlaG/YvyC family protein